ncbi:methyltransferase domain-containing protein [Flagellimonas sp. HMM57]|uniref:SAM-dependent methyltransferase n=1 Tax=unclassified Flagellimonas TaxID=2644544 RepID=UPI0013D5C4E4|nr:MULTISPECIES: class I SAM-dependent methyltransferase [unclassified Flagellimonas]UII74899.1 methyltransferase domain-containing protein [Flagellimonas sp. HMM57]
MKDLTLEKQYYATENNPKIEVDIIDFYNEATEDYEFWSKDFNMHFGYFNLFKTNPLKRDEMLNEMNKQVLGRLNIGKSKSLLADLGCGMGGSMRYALKRNKNLSAIGVTLSEFQVNEGNKLLKDLNAVILKENYNRTSLVSNSCDGAIAIESFCHSGHDKASFAEAYRILKPNSKLVIADAFLKKDAEQLCYGSSMAYNKLCDHWSLEKLGAIKNVVNDLKKVGFKNVAVEDISFRVAPSVLHVPFAIVGFMFKKLWRNRTLKKESLHNLKGSFYALLSGLHMKSFGYYLITCTK